MQPDMPPPTGMSRSAVDRLRAGSCAGGLAAYTPMCSISCTYVVFKSAPGSWRGEALTSAVGPAAYGE